MLALVILAARLAIAVKVMVSEEEEADIRCSGGMSGGDDGCGDGLTGIMCSRCRAGYHLAYGEYGGDPTCQRCPTHNTTGGLLDGVFNAMLTRSVGGTVDETADTLALERRTPPPFGLLFVLTHIAVVICLLILLLQVHIRACRSKTDPSTEDDGEPKAEEEGAEAEEEEESYYNLATGLHAIYGDAQIFAFMPVTINIVWPAPVRAVLSWYNGIALNFPDWIYKQQGMQCGIPSTLF